MCGIIYIEKGERADIERSLTTLNHRGPDEQAYLQGRGLIGVTRLAIVDVENGHQPIVTDDGRYGIAYNGEVYNHKELKEGLEVRGIRFHTRCDTEVVLNSVAEEGSKAPEEFDGQFAYVVEDKETGEVYAARDHFGIQPLYFGQGKNGLVIASEIPALLENGVSGEAVRSLPQGCRLRYSPNKGLELERYYDLRNQVHQEKTDPEKLYYLLEKAVAKRVPDEVEYAVILSGIDSSSVTYFSYKQGKKPKVAYTVATDLESRDVQSARILAKQIGIESRVLELDDQFVEDRLGDVVKAMVTPLYFPLINAFPTLRLAEEAKKDGIKVILNGDGSDEANLGYDYLWELFDPKFIKENALDLMLSIGDHECVRSDRIFASRGLEVRPPFLDKELVEYALSTPFEERLPELDNEKLKWQLRQAMRGKLPDFIVNRKKENMYRSVGVMPLVERVADRLMSDGEYRQYLDFLKDKGWESWIMGGKAGALFHKTWARLYPELARVPLSDISCEFRESRNYNNLDELSRFWAIASGGINLRGWNGSIK